jgi:signal transduction histidine kinase
MPWKSIRWQLPLSYAAIALLAALALGLALILPLRDTYLELERDYLNRNAREIGQVIAQALQRATPGADAQAQAQALAFLTQARVRVFDLGGQLILDSGPVAPSSVLALPPQIPVPTALPPLPALPALPAFPATAPAPPVSPQVGFQPEVMAPAIAFTAPVTSSLNLDGERVQLGGDVLFAIVADGAPDTVTPTVMTPGQSVSGSVPGTRLFVNPSLYGFNLGAEASLDGRRSDQVVRQPYADAAGRLLGAVELSEGPAYGRDIVETVARGWAIASAIAVLIAAAVGLIISRRISTPLAALTDVTARMAQGDLAARANVRRDDELGALAHSFNEMAERVEGTVTTLRQFASDAAHEINTPLTALRTRLDLAERDGNPADVREAREQAARLEQLAAGLLDLSRIESGVASAKRHALDLTQLAREASEPFASRAEQRGVNFALDLPSQAVHVMADAGQLQRAIGNVLDNAVKFTSAGGAVTLTVRMQDQQAEVIIEDTGIGIPADELPHLFKRFHRGSNTSAYPGNGLGLAVARAIVDSHGGSIHAENTARGARFTLRLPLAPSAFLPG